jgi:hypothetical protein
MSIASGRPWSAEWPATRRMRRISTLEAVVDA